MSGVGAGDSAVTVSDTVLARGRQFLILDGPAGRKDLWLWEHSQRVMHTTSLLLQTPDLLPERPDPMAAMLAALFHDAGWAVQVREGRMTTLQVQLRPTNDEQRELGAKALVAELSGTAPGETLLLAAEAIRQCNHRHSTMPEAQIVVDAENLDEIGMLHVVRQIRQAQFEGRPLETILANWSRQREYKYWDARIKESLRFELCRTLARARLVAVDEFMQALARDLSADDVRRFNASAGAPPE